MDHNVWSIMTGQTSQSHMTSAQKVVEHTCGDFYNCLPYPSKINYSCHYRIPQGLFEYLVCAQCHESIHTLSLKHQHWDEWRTVSFTVRLTASCMLREQKGWWKEKGVVWWEWEGKVKREGGRHPLTLCYVTHAAAFSTCRCGLLSPPAHVFFSYMIWAINTSQVL